MASNRELTTIALFNHKGGVSKTTTHKGGVSKTTTSFNLGWKLAEHGHTVVLFDADPQCNLTGMVTGYTGLSDLDQFYKDIVERGTIYENPLTGRLHASRGLPRVSA